MALAVASDRSGAVGTRSSNDAPRHDPYDPAYVRAEMEARSR